MKARSAKVEDHKTRHAEFSIADDLVGAEHGELAEVRVALIRAREQIGTEVQRRVEAEKEFERLVTTEREQLRKKLHDGIGQSLTTICFLASGLRSKLRSRGMNDCTELDEIIGMLNEAIAESREMAASCDAPRPTLTPVSP